MDFLVAGFFSFIFSTIHGFSTFIERKKMSLPWKNWWLIWNTLCTNHCTRFLDCILHIIMPLCADPFCRVWKDWWYTQFSVNSLNLIYEFCECDSYKVNTDFNLVQFTLVHYRKSSHYSILSDSWRFFPFVHRSRTNQVRKWIGLQFLDAKISYLMSLSFQSWMLVVVVLLLLNEIFAVPDNLIKYLINFYSIFGYFCSSSAYWISFSMWIHHNPTHTYISLVILTISLHIFIASFQFSIVSISEFSFDFRFHRHVFFSHFKPLIYFNYNLSYS